MQRAPVGALCIECSTDLFGRQWQRPNQAFAGVAEDRVCVRNLEMVDEAWTFHGVLRDFFEVAELVLGDANTLGGGEVRAAIGAGNGGHVGSLEK